MGVGLGALFAAMLQSYSFNFMGQRLGWRVRVLMMRALLRQEIGWYDDERNSSGVLTSKLSSDALAVKGQFGDTMGLVTQVRVCSGESLLAVRFAYCTTNKCCLWINPPFIRDAPEFDDLSCWLHHSRGLFMAHDAGGHGHPADPPVCCYDPDKVDPGIRQQRSRHVRIGKSNGL